MDPMRKPLRMKKRSIPKKMVIDVIAHDRSIVRCVSYVKMVVTWYWTTLRIATTRIPCSAG